MGATPGAPPLGGGQGASTVTARGPRWLTKGLPPWVGGEGLAPELTASLDDFSELSKRLARPRSGRRRRWPKASGAPCKPGKERRSRDPGRAENRRQSRVFSKRGAARSVATQPPDAAQLAKKQTVQAQHSLDGGLEYASAGELAICPLSRTLGWPPFGSIASFASPPNQLKTLRMEGSARRYT